MESIYDKFIHKLKTVRNKNRATLVYLWGDLGSGKTTFTKNLCKHLGLGVDITSPTFTILKRYSFEALGFKNLIHIDAYRLDGYNDLLKIRFDDYLQSKENLIFIEWPSIIENENFKADMNIRFEYGDDINNRSIEFD